jgi:hypothetical protein
MEPFAVRRTLIPILGLREPILGLRELFCLEEL